MHTLPAGAMAFRTKVLAAWKPTRHLATALAHGTLVIARLSIYRHRDARPRGSPPPPFCFRPRQAMVKSRPCPSILRFIQPRSGYRHGAPKGDGWLHQPIWDGFARRSSRMVPACGSTPRAALIIHRPPGDRQSPNVKT
jgi:hypothetical protein